MKPILKPACTAVRDIALAAVLAAVPGSAAMAGGFYTPYQSASALGTALAGASARSDDASFFFYNPATIADLGRLSVAVNAEGFFPSAKIYPGQSVSPLNQDLSSFGGSGEMTRPAVAPAGFVSVPLTQNLTFGAGFTAPFAVIINTDPNWAGRFHLLKTDMRATNYSAAATLQLSPAFAISGGVQVQRFEGEFDKSELIPTFFGPVEARGFLKGKGTAVGAIAGMLIKPSDMMRIGVSYRSQLTHDLEGTAGAYLAGIPVESVRFDLVTPQVLSVGLEQRISAQLRFFGEAQWVNWSQFKGFNISFASGRPNELRPQVWRDTALAGIGFGYALRAGTEITAGVSIDSAVTSGGVNTLSPDGFRTMVAVGLNQIISERIRLSLSYAHMFIDDATVSVNTIREGILTGQASSHTDMLGVTARIDW